MQDPGGGLEGFQGVGPVHEQDVHAVSLQILEGVGHIAPDKIRGAVAEGFAVLPVEPGLGGDEDSVPAFFLRQGPADNLFGEAEAVNRGRVDEIDALVDGGVNGLDGLLFVGAAPHPAPDGPGAESDAGNLQIRAGNVW